MWNFFEPTEARWYSWSLDGAILWMRKNGEEWRFALKSIPFKQIEHDTHGPDSTEPPEATEVSLSVARGKRVALRPYPSSMPYLVAARNDVKIHAGTEAWFTIALPPLFRVELESGTVLFEASPFFTTTTWFGDKTSGNLCLSLPIDLDPECRNENGDLVDSATKESLERAAHYLSCRSLIHCRIAVKNHSKEALEVKRLAIFTNLMSVYEKDDTLVSDTIVITATADGSLQTNIDDTGTKHLRKVHSAPKSGLNEVLIQKGVSFLRSIAGL